MLAMVRYSVLCTTRHELKDCCECLSDLCVQAAAQEGSTAPPALEEVVDLHFAALVNKNDRLVELDGRKSFPIDHGKTSASTLLQV